MVHLGDGRAVAGDADEAHEPLVARLDGCAQRAVLAHRDVPLARVHEAVQLDEVDDGTCMRSSERRIWSRAGP